MKFLKTSLQAAAIFSWLITFAQLILLAFLKRSYAIDTTGASSIGIIGSADGPTTIFVSTNTFGFIHSFLKLCPYIAVISTLILVALRLRRNG